MSMVQGWAEAVEMLMSRLENNMEVLGIPNHEQNEGKHPKNSGPAQNKHDAPGRHVPDLTHLQEELGEFALEALSDFRAQFPVGCLLHESHACSWEKYVCFAGAARAWWNVSYCHDTGKLRVLRWTAAALSLYNTCVAVVASCLHAMTQRWPACPHAMPCHAMAQRWQVAKGRHT